MQGILGKWIYWYSLYILRTLTGYQVLFFFFLFFSMVCHWNHRHEISHNWLQTNNVTWTNMHMLFIAQNIVFLLLLLNEWMHSWSAQSGNHLHCWFFDLIWSSLKERSAILSKVEIWSSINRGFKALVCSCVL